MTRKWVFCLILCMSMLLPATVGCIGGEANVPDTSTVEPDTEQVAVEAESVTAQPAQTPESAETAPTAAPMSTRAPREGDIATNFPDYDTGTDADYSYQSDELRIAIRRCEDPDEDIPLVYYVADVWVRNIHSLRMGFGNGAYNSGREDPEQFAARENAIFAVNGTMNSGLVLHNGGEQSRGVEKSDMNYRSGIVVLYRDGSVRTINLAKGESYRYKTENERNGGIWQAFQFGPVLVQDGEMMTGLKKNERQPRTIFGYVEPGHYIIVAVDGRTKVSIGMTETEMAELMFDLGCTQAMNLDGGYSTSMLFMGETINERVNDDRNVNDMLLFAEYDADGSAPALSTVHAQKFSGK